MVCIFLIAVVLLQRGKGAEIGAVFGSGASSTVFGGRGAGNFLTKLTTASAAVFMGTSLTLSYLWTVGSGDRLFESGLPEGVLERTTPPEETNLFEEVGTVPAEPAAAASPSETAPATETPEPAAAGVDALEEAAVADPAAAELAQEARAAAEAEAAEAAPEGTAPSLPPLTEPAQP